MNDLQTCSCRLDSIASARSFETFGYAVEHRDVRERRYKIYCRDFCTPRASFALPDKS